MLTEKEINAAAQKAAIAIRETSKTGDRVKLHVQIMEDHDGGRAVVIAPEGQFKTPSALLRTVSVYHTADIADRIREALTDLFIEMPAEFAAKVPVVRAADAEEPKFGISWEEFEALCPLPEDDGSEFTAAELAETELSDHFFDSFELGHLRHEGHRMTISVSVPNSDGTLAPFMALHPDDFEHLEFAMEGLQDLARDVSEMIDAPLEIHTQLWIDGKVIASPILRAHTPQMMHAEVHESDLRRQGSDRRSIARMCRHMRLYRSGAYLTTPPIVRDLMEALQNFKFTS